MKYTQLGRYIKDNKLKTPHSNKKNPQMKNAHLENTNIVKTPMRKCIKYIFLNQKK